MSKARTMVGRRIRDDYNQVIGEVIEWNPCSPGSDLRVRRDDGRVIAISSHPILVKPIDGAGALPDRLKACAKIRRDVDKQLERIRKQHVLDFNKPWPGAEFGKTIIGQALTKKRK